MEKEFDSVETEEVSESKGRKQSQETNEIDEELDNRYDSYLKGDQSPDFKFVSNGERSLEREKAQEYNEKENVKSELDDKYNEYIQSGKEFSYGSERANDVDDDKK